MYLIEIRFQGKARKQLKKFVDTSQTKFGVKRNKRTVPHITIAGPLFTNDVRRLVRTVEEMCRKTPIMKFAINGYGFFEDTRVAYMKIMPSESLDEFRAALSERLSQFCKMQSFDRDRKFYFHSTIARDMQRAKFNQMKSWLDEQEKISRKQYVMRLTILKKGLIVAEYDFFQRRLLQRSQAKNKQVYERSIKLLREYIQTDKEKVEYIELGQKPLPLLKRTWYKIINFFG